jgi:hypothetical protein
MVRVEGGGHRHPCSRWSSYFIAKCSVCRSHQALRVQNKPTRGPDTARSEPLRSSRGVPRIRSNVPAQSQEFTACEYPSSSIPERVRKTRVRVQRNGVEHNPAGGCPFRLRSKGFQRTLLESWRGHTHVSSRGRHADNPISRSMGIGYVQAVHAPVQGIRVIARVKDRQRLEAHEQPPVKHTALSHQGGSTHPTGITSRTHPRLP